jgi:hypothetical protein
LHGQQAAVPGAAAGETGAVPPDTQAAGAQHDHQVINKVNSFKLLLLLFTTSLGGICLDLISPILSKHCLCRKILQKNIVFTIKF